MDDFEHALRHSVIDPPCSLLCEIHATLIYNLRTVPFNRHSAVLSLFHAKDTLEEEHRFWGVTIDSLAAVMADVGNNWERVPLRTQDARAGWEDALVGCLKDVSSATSRFWSLKDFSSMPHWRIFPACGRY